jgi:ankyrin repeat protein
VKLDASWKWLVEAPLSPTWRNRLELCLGVVLSGAVVVGLSAMIHPDPSKLAAAHGHGAPRVVSSALRASAPAEPPPPPTMTAAFMTAVRAGDVRAMTNAYTPGMPLQGTLGAAARSGKKAAVVWVLDHGADVHDEETSPYSPVLSADANLDIVALLRERGAAEPTLDDAAMANAPNAVSRLLAAHPNVNAQGSSPLQAAASSTNGTAANRRLIVTRLLAEGADPNRDGGGNPSSLSGVITHCDDEGSDAGDCMSLVQLLLDRGARVTGDALAAALSLDDATRSAPLDALLALPIEPGVTAVALANATSANPRDLKRVVAKGIDWAWHDGEEDAALPVLAAVQHGDRDYVRALLDVGAPVDVHFKDGSSALATAIDNAASNSAQARIVELLVTRGANVNRRLPDGRTPLFAAAESGELRVVNFLLARGARVNDLVLDDMALDIADQNGHQPAARVLHAHGARRARPQYR